jgi:hypothetical protein
MEQLETDEKLVNKKDNNSKYVLFGVWAFIIIAAVLLLIKILQSPPVPVGK